MPRKRVKQKKKSEIVTGSESTEMIYSTENQARKLDKEKQAFRGFRARLFSVISRKPLKGFGTIGLVLLAAMSGMILAVSILSTTIPEASAIPSNTKWFLYNNGGTSISSPGTMSETAQSGTTTQNLYGSTTYYWASVNTYELSSADSGTWTFHLVYSYFDYPRPKTITVTVYYSASRTALGTFMGSGSVLVSSLPDYPSYYDISIAVTAPTASAQYIQLSYSCDASKNQYLTMKASTSSVGDTYLLVPEYALLALIVAPLLPAFMKSKRTSERGNRISSPSHAD